MSHPRSDSEDNPVFVEPMELDHRSEKPADGESSYEDAIHYIDEFPETTTVPQVVVPTLEELGYHRSKYVKARTLSVQPQVVKVLEELEAEDGKLSYRVRLGDGHVKEVRLRVRGDDRGSVNGADRCRLRSSRRSTRTEVARLIST